MDFIRPLFGLIFFIFFTYVLSENKRLIPWRLVFSCIFLQFFMAIVMLKTPFIQDALLYFNNIILMLDKSSKDGASFIFGYIGGGATPFEIKNPANNFIIAFQVLPIIIFVSAISSLLFHLGILQKIISFLSWILKKTIRVDGATAFGVSSSVFLGIIEAPIFVKAYLPKLSRSGLFTLITAGMSTVAGTVMVLYAGLLNSVIENASAQILIASLMSAPAAIMFSQILIPPVNEVEVEITPLTSSTSNVFEAIIKGTNEGVSMVISISGILLVLFAFISLINTCLLLLPTQGPITIQYLAGYLFTPFCYLMGIELPELFSAAQLMGTKLLLNEFVAYSEMPKALGDPKNIMIMTYALCGFANFGSLGILVGGLSPLMPERKNEVVSLSLFALVSGTLSTMFTGTIMAILW